MQKVFVSIIILIIMSANWNPWHGCHKYSEGCKNCYVFRGDAKYDRDTENVVKTQSFNMPISKNRKGEYKINSGELVWLCFSSDFFLSDADVWRADAWKMIKERSDCVFLFITKRILRFYDCIPPDWGEGYDNVTIVTTVENQKRADERLPFFLSLPIKHKCITSEPLLQEIDLSPYLNETIESVVAGGESGENARECRYEWILKIREACVNNNVPFSFKQTGANFIKDGVRYTVPRKYQHIQAKKANIDFRPKFRF